MSFREKGKQSQFKIKALEERDDSGDSEYWATYAQVLSKKKERLWEALLEALEKYRYHIYLILSYDVTVINPFALRKAKTPQSFGLSECNRVKWIMSCHKNHMTTSALTLWCKHITSLTMSVQHCFQIVIVFILKAINSYFKGHMINRSLHEWSFQNEIYETNQRLMPSIAYEMTNDHSYKIL